jgi:hypothetical protein
VEIADALEDQRIATCLPFLLEAGFSARDALDHADFDGGVARPTMAAR